ncbi:5'-methylthioadenosine/S-adenosylhomocysteine nucleosidase [Paludibacterium sp. B53371]|uniref:5'-methylthioadenosine/S-adenosylhomocysteine nucleosidase family protein n=1 Tax=Paludibacterium sp. B53371 TaxID=2806263 RepID=UPI001C04E432|nr:5'-methylthioadenosine/S-adenosylhomocysteine nucleosidase [Paludibacterium sp. B53371]
MKILIMAAFAAEAASLHQHLAKQGAWQTAAIPGLASARTMSCLDHEICLACTGVGTEEAAISTTAALRAWQPECVLMCGTAGGVGPGWRVGDVVAGSRILNMDLLTLPAILQGTPFEHCLHNDNTQRQLETEWPCDPVLLRLACQLPEVHAGTIFCSNSFPVPATHFPRMQAEGSGVIEMESAGVARALHRFGQTPMLTLRAISNLINERGEDQGTAEGSIERCARHLSTTVQGLLAAL